MKRDTLFREFGDLTVFYSDWDSCKPGHRHSYELVNEFLIHYIHSGKGTFYCDGKVYNLCAGQAFLIAEKRGVYIADRAQPWTYSWIRFSGETGRRFLRTLNLSSDNPIYTTENHDAVMNCLKRINATVKSENEFLIHAVFLELFGTMVRFSANETFSPRNAADEFIDKCKSFLLTNYEKKITASDLADAAGVEYSYLFRLFKKNLGVSPGNYIIDFKLDKAAAMIREFGKPVGEAAAAVGYDDRVAFSKLFKMRYGVSPSVYAGMRDCE